MRIGQEVWSIQWLIQWLILKVNNASTDFELQNELNPQFGIKKTRTFQVVSFPTSR